MNTVRNIPAYVLNPSYKMTHIIAARVNDGGLQFRQCFGSKSAANNKLKKLAYIYPDVEFHVFAIKDLS